MNNDWILKSVTAEYRDGEFVFYRAIYSDGLNELDEWYRLSDSIPTILIKKDLND